MSIREAPKPVEIPHSNLPSLAALQAGDLPHEWDGLQALGRYIVLARIDVGNSISAGGLVIPENAQLPAWVTVAVGPDVTGVKVWDRVLMIYKQPDCVVVNHDGRDFMLAPMELLACVLPMPDPATRPRLVKTNGVILQ